MPLSTAGIQLLYGDTVGAITNLVGGVRKWNKLPVSVPDEIETTEIDLRNADGSAKMLKAFAPGYENPGNLQANIGVDDDGTAMATLYALRKSHAVKFWAITWPSGLWIETKGYLNTLEPVANEKDQTIFAADIKCSEEDSVLHPATEAVRLVSVAKTGVKTITMTFSAAVTAAQFNAANVHISHNGVAVVADSIAQGAANTLTATSTTWQASPTGDIWYLLGVPAGVVLPPSMVVG